MNAQESSPDLLSGYVELSVETSMCFEEIGRIVALVENAARQAVSERDVAGAGTK
jgi:hypothetical protein